MRQRIAELAALMDGSGNFGGVVRRNAARIGETAEELLETRLIVGDERIGFAIRAIKQRLSRAGRSAMTGSHKKNGVLIMIVDKAVNVAKQEIQARCRSPVSHQSMLDIFPVKSFLHERVASQINLANGKIVCRAPVLVDTGKFFLRNRLIEPLPRCPDNRLSHYSSFT